MAVPDRYPLLSSVVRIASSCHLSPHARLISLTRCLATAYSCSATVYLADGEQRHLVSMISSSGPTQTVPCRIPLGEGVRGAVHPDELLRNGSGEMISFPVVKGGSLFGAVALELQQGMPRRGVDRKVLNDICRVVAGVIEEKNLEEQAETRTRHAAIIRDLGGLLNKVASPQDIVARILNFCAARTKSSCIVVRIMPDRGIPGGAFKKCQNSLRRCLPGLLDQESSLSAQVLDSGKPLHKESLHLSAEFPPSVVSVPLLFDGYIFGTMTVYCPRRKNGGWLIFDQACLDLFTGFDVMIVF